VVTLGGDLVRLVSNVQYAGPGGSADLYGVYFADETQHQEHRLWVDHAVPNCRSNVLYKGALQGEKARTVWIGDVRIRPAATGTDTYELNRNLVLTDGARADSVPNLEIETGEIVGAGHASATGRFDDEQLFYLCSRGIDAETARRLAALGYVAASGVLAPGPLPDPRSRRAELATLDAAILALQEERPAAAAPLLERLLAANPRMPDVHLLLAATRERLGRNREAAESYRQAFAASGAAPIMAYIVARGLLKLGQVDEARSFAELGRSAAGTGVSVAAAAALDVQIALARNDLDAALAGLPRLNGAAEAAPLRRAVGMRLADAGRSQEALAVLEPLAGGGDAATLDAIAVALSETGRDQEAATVAGRVLAAAPRDARAHQILGTVALHREQPAEARRQLQLAVELDPRLAIAWNTLGVARLKLEGPGPALAAWHKAVEIAPDYWKALYNIWLVSAAMGRKAEARQALERFVAKAPPDLFGPDLVKARTLLRELGG